MWTGNKALYFDIIQKGTLYVELINSKLKIAGGIVFIINQTVELNICTTEKQDFALSIVLSIIFNPSISKPCA